MSETSDRLLRAYQEQETRFIERRFPLQFAPEVPALREVYSQAKGFHSRCRGAQRSCWRPRS